MVLSEEIVLVVPPTIPIEVESHVQVRFTVCGGDRKPLRVLARLGDDVLSITDMAATDTSTCMLNIAVKSAGLIELAAVTDDGLLLCTPAKLLAAPQEIAHEMAQLARRCARELRFRRGNIQGRVDNGLNALANEIANLELDVDEDRDQVEEMAWCKYVRPLIQDLGVILEDQGSRKSNTERTLSRVLEYFIRNRAYATAQFLLGLVAQHGVPILWHGNQIAANEIDLQALHKTGPAQ